MVSARGERAAMSGYKAQYVEFAQKVYDAILNESLEEIRVADAEEKVGKLDDICYVTKTEVHAYQIKWTIDDHSFGYSDFMDLLPPIVDGWLKLRNQYPDKIVIPHLLTNRKGTTEGQSIKDNRNAVIGFFPDFRKDVIEGLKAGRSVPVKWNDVMAKMQSDIHQKTGHQLPDEDFNAFWRVFDFVTDYQQEDIPVKDAVETLRTQHLWQIVDLIIEMAASKERLVTKSCDEILRELGLKSYMKRRYNHNLVVDLESYEPIQSAIDQLNIQLRSKTKGYIFLEGTPGSGKSTILTRWSQSIPNHSVRYYAFDFTNPSSQQLNDSARGEKVLFLCEMVRQLGENGYDPPYKALLNHDEIYLKEFFNAQLDKIHEEYEKTHLPLVIIVDGLDHIEREYTSCQTSLLEALPTTNELPEGVVFVLGSQYYRNLGLNAHILREYEREDSTVKMSPFTSEEVAHLAAKILGNIPLSEEWLQALVAKSAGHPLYLRYILNQLKETPDLSIDMLPSYDTDIEVYYSQITGDALHNDSTCKFLGLLARVFGEIKDDFLREWPIDIQVQKDAFRRLGHLFLYNPNTNTRTFFHNSFRQYLLKETARDYLSGDYREELDKAYYKELVQYVRSSKVESIWNIGCYLFKSGDEEAFVQSITPENIIAQIREYRPIWHAQRDIEWGAQIAAKRNDVYLMARMLLLYSQIDQMQAQEYDASSLIEDFLRLGMADVAKIQLREGKTLHCSQDSALRLARMFYEFGEVREAQILFELSYPNFLSLAVGPQSRRDDLQDYTDVLHEWVQTATCFRSIESIDEKIQTFVDFLKNVARNTNEKFDEDEEWYAMKIKVVEALERSDRWDELEEYQKSFPAKYRKRVQFIIQRDKIQRLLSSETSMETLQREFHTLQTYYTLLRTKQRDSLDLMMASIAHRVGMDNSTIKQYLDKVQWNQLPSFSQEMMYDGGFDRLRQRIRYVELRTYVGDEEPVSQLVPDTAYNADEGLLVNYLRMVYKVAQWSGSAHREGHNSSMEPVQMIKPYLLFFDGCVDNNHDRHAYNIEKQRGDFYEYLVRTAAQCGAETVYEVGKAVQELYERGYWKANVGDVRKTISALYHYGIGVEWTKTMLEQIEVKMFEGQDIYGKQKEAIEQGRAWLETGERERALNMFHQAVMEASGVGYRKEYQPSTMVEWISAANRNDPEHAVERIHWMTTRLHAIEDSCETRTALRAADKLLDETLAFNPGMGMKLGMWLLDAELGSVEDVSWALIQTMLKRVQSEDEYRVVFRYFTQLHLYIQNDGYDVNTKLLEDVYAKGKELLGDNYHVYVDELRRCIMTQCTERVQDAMSKKLEELVRPADEHLEERGKRPVCDSPDRESENLVNKAEELFGNGNKEEAWNVAMQALQTSHYYGWAAYYDGGTRLNACRMLVKMDKQKGREIALRQLAEDLPKHISYDAMHYLDDIVAMLEDTPDEQRLFDEQFRYMNRILRQDSVRPEDAPEIEPNDDGVREMMVKWLIHLMKMPVLCIADKAKTQLAYMIDAGMTDILSYMQEYGCDPSDILEVGMCVRELKSDALACFKDYVTGLADSDNYQYRIYVRAIMHDLHEPLPVISKKKHLPAIYTMVLPSKQSVMFRQPSLEEGYVDWDNPLSVTSVCRHLVAYLSYCSDFEKTNIATRVMQILKSRWREADWDNMANWYQEEEKKMANHYYNIGLRYPYRRLRVTPIWNAMMEVVSELQDGGAIPAPYDDNVFMTRDFASVLHIEHPKPFFVQRIADKDAWSVNDQWYRQASESERLSDQLVMVGDRFVIGEVTHVIKPGDSPAIEDFSMTISYSRAQNQEEQLFGDGMHQRPTSDYLSKHIDDRHIILIRDGYFANNRIKQRWIAFNPALALILGWRPVEDGCFAWVNESGMKMVESVYWQNGNVNYHGRENIELGEGWYVLASAEAVEQLQAFGTLYLHQLIVRRRDSDYTVPSSKEYRVQYAQY